MPQQLQTGASIIIKPGVKAELEEGELDLSGWQGTIIEISDDDILVAWDSQTLQAIPEAQVGAWLDGGQDWTLMLLERDDVAPAPARDADPTAATAVARQRSAGHGYDWDEIQRQQEDMATFFLDFFGLDDAEWGEETVAPFDFDAFCAQWSIPLEEQSVLRQCMQKGTDDYYANKYYKDYRGGSPQGSINEMNIPFAFGYGLLHMLDEEQLSQDVKLAGCQHVLTILNPDEPDGVPYGIITALGYIADTQHLTYEAFLLAMLAMEHAHDGYFFPFDWTLGATREAIAILVNWIIAQPKIPAPEQIWWVWLFSLRLSQARETSYHLVQTLADTWLNNTQFNDETKAALCWAWLTHAQNPGQVPLGWQLMSHFLRGDRTGLEQTMADANIDPAVVELPDEMPSSHRGWEFFDEMRQVGRLSAVLLRTAVVGMVQTGTDLSTVAEMVWEQREPSDADAAQNGVADAIVHFHDQLTPAELRQLIEKGINEGRWGVRKKFYDVSTQFYGTEYLQQALADDAKSVRKWAQKKLATLE